MSTYDPRMTARGAAMLLTRKLRALGYDADVLCAGSGTAHWAVRLRSRWTKKLLAGEGLVPGFPVAGEDWRAVALSAEILAFQPAWAQPQRNPIKKRASPRSGGTIQAVQQQTPETGQESSMSKNTASKNSNKNPERKAAKSVTRDAEAVANEQVWEKLAKLYRVKMGDWTGKDAVKVESRIARDWIKLEKQLGRAVTDGMVEAYIQSRDIEQEWKEEAKQEMKVPPTKEENEAAAKAIAEQGKAEPKPTKRAKRADGDKKPGRGPQIELGKTQSGQRIVCPSNRFAAVRNAVTRGNVEAAVTALKRALPDYKKQDYLDAAKLYAEREHQTMAEMCEAVGRNMD